MSDSRPINIGYVGYGFATRVFHVPNSSRNPRYKIHSFVQRRETPIDKKTGGPSPRCQDDFPDAKRYASIDEMVQDKEVELIVAVTPTESHYELLHKAISAGKHAEKPLCASAKECDELIQLAKEKGVIVTCFQSRRYDSDFLTLQKLLRQNTLGQITTAEIHYDVNYPYWATRNTDKTYKPGSGLLFGLGSHTLNQAIHLFGRPSRVTGFWRVLRNPEDPSFKSESEDTFRVVLHYAEKPWLEVVVSTTVVSPMINSQKFLIQGREGSFVKFGWDVQEEQILAGMQTDNPIYGVEPEQIWGLLTTKTQVLPTQEKQKEFWNGDLWVGKLESERGKYADYYEDLAKSIRDGATLVIDPKESRDALRVAELARESAIQGRTLDFEG